MLIKSIPTHIIASKCDVTLEEAWKWREGEVEVPSEYQEILNGIPNEREYDSQNVILRLKESDVLVLVCNARKKKYMWELSLKSSVERWLRADTITVSLADWLAEMSLRLTNKDILWPYTELTYSYSKPCLDINYPNGKVEKLKIGVELISIISDDTTGANLKQLYTELCNSMRDIIDEAKKREGLEKVQELLDMVSDDPEDVFKKDIERMAEEWCTKHLTGSATTDGPGVEPIHTFINGREYIGNMHITSTTIGSCFKEVDKSSINDTVLFTGQGFLQGSTFLETFEKDGLIKIVPEFPDSLKVVESAHKWLWPQAPKLALEAIRVSGVSKSHETALSELLLQLITSIRRRLAVSGVVAREEIAGVSFLDDPTITLAKVNREVFDGTWFPKSRPLSRPFKVYSSHIAAGENVFWAMLYSSLIPTKSIRKQALLFFGSGSSFKTTFLSKVYARMLAGTIRVTPEGTLKFKRNTTTAGVVARTKSEDATKAETFGEPNTPNNLVMWFEEVENFNIEHSNYKNLKTQLGQNAMVINVKYARSRKALPVSRMVVVDSNYPPNNFKYSKESIDRCAEVVMFSQSGLIYDDSRYNIDNDNKHLYWSSLFSRDEEAGMPFALDLPFGYIPTEEDKYDYLALLLFRDIMSYGKTCYQKLTGSKKEELGTFNPLQTFQYDRKELALAYIKLMQLDKTTPDADNRLNPLTVAQYFLRAGIKYNPDSVLTWEQLTEVANYMTEELKATIDKKHSSKKEFSIHLRDSCFRGAWLGRDTYKRFLGAGSEVDYIYHTEEGIQGLELEKWFTDIMLDETGTNKLRAIRDYVQSELQQQYIERLEDRSLSDILIKKQKDSKL